MKVLCSVDQSELREIREMQDRQKKLHLPIMPLTFLDLEVKSGEGDVTQKYSDRSKSWVRNMYNLLTMQHLSIPSSFFSGSYGIGNLALAQSNGTSFASFYWAGDMRRLIDTRVDEGYGHKIDTFTSIWGIITGTGSTAETFESYNLVARVSHGNGEGQLWHFPSVLGTDILPTWDGVENKFKEVIKRVFENRSGSPIPINEVGLASVLNTGEVNKRNFLLARDLLTSTITVAPGDFLTVTYTIEVPYPA